MTLSVETQNEIKAMVRGGFEERDRIVEIFCEEMYSPGELAPQDVETAVASAIRELETEKASWPKITDCDRLDAVFEALNKQGIVSIQNAGYTQSDGYSDVMEMHGDSDDPRNNIGYCFYHQQDLERALAGGGLLLAFGPIDPEKEETDGATIGRIIVDLLKGAGFSVEWPGTFDKRIEITAIDWKRR